MYRMLQTGRMADCRLIEAIPSRMHDEKRPGDVLKVTGDPLDDVADDARYGIYTFVISIPKPRDLVVREELKSLAEERRPNISPDSPPTDDGRIAICSACSTRQVRAATIDRRRMGNRLDSETTTQQNAPAADQPQKAREEDLTEVAEIISPGTRRLPGQFSASRSHARDVRSCCPVPSIVREAD